MLSWAWPMPKPTETTGLPSAPPSDRVAGRIAEGKWGQGATRSERRQAPYPRRQPGLGATILGLQNRRDRRSSDRHIHIGFDSGNGWLSRPAAGRKTSYSLNAEGGLTITMEGVSRDNEETLFNPTSHIYFNLSGDAKRQITEHTLQLACEEVLELDVDKLPTGAKQVVVGTAFDFLEATVIGEAIRKRPEGFDDVFLMQPDQQPQADLQR